MSSSVRSEHSQMLLFLVVALLLASTRGFVFPTAKSATCSNPSAHTSPRSGLSAAPRVSLAEGDNTATIPSSNGASYIRWKTPSSSNASAFTNVWELQTAVTTFQRTNPKTKETERIELHAQVHFGEKDYFDFYNRPAFREKQDEILYELLVDESLLGLSQDKAGRVLTQRLQASPHDESLAQDYGWQCQVNVIDYTQPNWKHADYTRQELVQQQQVSGGKTMDTNRPLWQQVSGGGTAFWQPAISALLVGPPSLFVATDTDDAAATKRKLFTNLFLPGNQFAGWLRAMLWMTVPAPEISVLLLDWSSLFLSSKSSAKFSPVTLPILQSLMTLQIAQLRQLVFGQVLVSGNSAQQRQQPQQQNQDWNLLVTQRNDHALRVLQSSLGSSSSFGRKQLALLYGCSHCPDLHAKLVKDLGFAPTKTEWRTAWSVAVPNTFASSEGPSVRDGTNKQGNDASVVLSDLANILPPTAWAALLVLFPLYLGVGAVDWVDTIHSSAVSLLESSDPLSFVSDWFLYLVRHVFLYVGVSKFALEWQDPNSKSNDIPGV